MADGGIEVSWSWSLEGPWLAEFRWGDYGASTRGWTKRGVRAAAERLRARLPDQLKPERPNRLGGLTEAQLEVWEAPPCPRCAGAIKVDWCDVTTLDDLAQGLRYFVIGETKCLTPGCADERGSKRVPIDLGATP